MTMTRVALLLLAAALGMTGLAGCGGDEAGTGESEEPEQPRADPDELQERYADLEREVDVEARAMERRLMVFYAPDGDDTAEQLRNLLGPSEREIEDDSFACSLGGVSCEVGEIENLLENDREDFAAEDEFSPDNCDVTTQTSYYRGYDLAETDAGAEYLGLYRDLSRAADGLPGDADALLAKAREMDEAEAAYEEASGFSAESERTLAQVEELAAQARTEGARAEEVLADAENRYAGYEARTEQARAEALALHGREGC